MRLGVCIVVVGMGGERAGEERNNGVFPLPLQMATTAKEALEMTPSLGIGDDIYRLKQVLFACSLTKCRRYLLSG